CIDKKRPKSTVKKRSLKRRKGRISLSGKARDAGCASAAARTPRDRGGVRRVEVSVAELGARHRCRFLTRKGRLSRTRKCSRPIQLRAKGATTWRFSKRARLPRGK